VSDPWNPRGDPAPVAGAPGRTSVRFATVLVLSKRDAFELCEACADAERALLRTGHAAEAARMAALFELVEGRLIMQSDCLPSSAARGVHRRASGQDEGFG